MRVKNTIILSFGIAVMIASPAAAQLRRGSPADTKVDVAITIQAAGQPYSFQGKAECHYAPVASIYNVVAEMWSVQQSDGQRSFTLTLWHPRSSSGDMFSLSVAGGGKSYVVNTVKAGGKSAATGSGKVTLAKSGTGGTFTINATAGNGAAITGMVNCSGFTMPMAEAGD